MKTIIPVIIIIILAIIFACNPGNLSETEVVVIRDITDIQLSQPKSEDITKLIDLDNSKWNGANFRYVDITDVSYNRTYQASIKSENQWMGNEFDRQKKVKGFSADISEILNEVEKVTIGKDNSSIYIPVARELNKLSQGSSQKKILLLYSDLMENTDELSLYDNNKLNLLKINPDSIQKYFEAQIPLQRLDGIKIYLIFQPSNTEEDRQYKIVSGFYKELFESKGATVEITANIN
jgi:hypothetical protein